MNLESKLQTLEGRVNKIAPLGVPSRNAVSEFQCAFNSTTLGVNAKFTIRDKRSIVAFTLKRNSSRDPGSAQVLQSWPANAVSEGQTLSFDDNDPSLRSQAALFYWVECVASNPAHTVTVGPQTVAKTSAQVAPGTPRQAFFSTIQTGSIVTVGCNVFPPTVPNSGLVYGPDPNFGSIQVDVAGYHGNPNAVTVAQSASTAFNFTLDATGETVTMTAYAVSITGIRNPSGLSATVVLSGNSIPCQIVNARADSLSTGEQISWPAGPEANITQFKVWRAPFGSSFGSASLIGTVTPTGASSYSFLDSNGLTDKWQYYIETVSPFGSSGASGFVTPFQLFSTVQIPTNGQTAATNNATIDSVDAGTSATVRVYGPGGVSSNYSRFTGYSPSGSSRPFGTITGLSYSTTYAIVWTGSALLAATAYTGTLPDSYEVVGQVTTVAAGGTGGTAGGGGTSGSRNGSRLALTL